MTGREDNPQSAEYCNPPVADGINNPPFRPVRTLLVNLVLVAAGLAAILGAFNLAAYYLAPLTPFAWERALLGGEVLGVRLDTEGAARQEALRRLADRVAAALDLPEDMPVFVHYNPSGIVNAFATFGGNIVVFQGLLDLLDSEDALAMVLAHEMAHVKHRDMIKGVVRVSGLLVLSLGVQGGGGYIDKLAEIGLSGYSRDQEKAADEAAVAVLARMYGRVGGARRFFTVLAGAEGRNVDARDAVGGVESMLASHPDTVLRLRSAEETARALGVAVDGELTPLSETFE